MLEKQRESLAASKNYQKVKAHVQRNKETYVVGAGCLAIGLAVGRGPELKQVVDSFKIQYKTTTTNVVTANLTRRGHPGFAMLNTKTGEQAASLRRMAELDGVSRAFIKAHAIGPDAIYKNLGEM